MQQSLQKHSATFTTHCLIIEDNQTDAAFLQQRLDNLGCTSDVTNELNFPDHMENSYDLIFTDINMPSISGFDLARTIRNSTLAIKNTPIIAVSSNPYSPKEATLCLNEHLNGYIEKPIDQDTLIEFLTQLAPQTMHNNTKRPRGFLSA